MKKLRVKSTRKKVKDVIKKHNEFKNSYFWHGNNKSSRLNWKNNFKFKFNHDEYEVLQSCYSSAKNVYYSCEIFKNGKKKDIRCLKKII